MRRQIRRRERGLDIFDIDRAGQISQRRILPLAVVFLDGTLMCLASCTTRQAAGAFTSPGCLTST